MGVWVLRTWWACLRLNAYRAYNVRMDDYLTTDEAAQAVGITTEFVRVLVRKGRIKAKKIGQTVLVERASLLQYRSEADAFNTRAQRKAKANKSTK